MKLTVNEDGVFLDSTRLRRVKKIDITSLTPYRKTVLLEIDVDDVDIRVPSELKAERSTTQDQ